MLIERNRSVLTIIDVQPSFLAGIFEQNRVLKRSEFLVRCAQTMNIPIFVSEQYPTRMGGTEPSLVNLIEGSGTLVEGKMVFSVSGCESYQTWLNATGRDQVILVGIETHICVSQTAHELLEWGKSVFIAEDAVSARSPLMHDIGMKRSCQAGAIPMHTEQAVYEWMRTADSEHFKDVLKIVKEFAGN